VTVVIAAWPENKRSPQLPPLTAVKSDVAMSCHVPGGRYEPVVYDSVAQCGAGPGSDVMVDVMHRNR